MRSSISNPTLSPIPSSRLSVPRASAIRLPAFESAYQTTGALEAGNSILAGSRIRSRYDRLGHVSKGDGTEIDALFQLSPPEFVAARNALAAQLKKAGRDDVASRVKSLAKPSISAWTVNQLYWKHRAAFDKLLATGERFRQAQASRLAGRSVDIHRVLNERREELSAMARLAAGILQRSSGAAPPGVMRRITASLEALSAYGTLEGAPRAGRLVEDVDPPGFDALAALVPRVGDGTRATVPSKVLAFQKEPKSPARGRKRSAADEEARKKERLAQLSAARAAKRDASHALVGARRAAVQAEAGLKKAATQAKETEGAMVAMEARLQKVASQAQEARQRARRAAVEAESAAQAVEEAERTLERATRELSILSLRSEHS